MRPTTHQASSDSAAIGEMPHPGIARRLTAADASRMSAHHSVAGLLTLATVILAAGGEALVLAHVAGALGLIMLACGAAAGITAWIAFGAPRTRKRHFRVTGRLPRIH